MKASSCSKTVLSIWQSTWHHNPEGSHLKLSADFNDWWNLHNMESPFLNVLNYNTKMHTALCEDFYYLGLHCIMLVVPVGKPSSKSLVKVVISSRLVLLET
jgi:hypothetical protein